MRELLREKYLCQIRPFYHDHGMIKILMGVRRCGKSTIMKQIAEELSTQGIPARNIAYLDLDNPMYNEIATPKELSELIQTSLIRSDGPCYLFIDEVQNVEGFETIINGYRNTGVSVFITGSNSYLLSTELTTKLTGRYVEFQIFPFSFQETEDYRRLNGMDTNIRGDFNEYLIYGGLPKRFDYPEASIQEKYTDSVLTEAINKDILDKRRVRDRPLLKSILSFISSIPSGEISSTSIANYLKKESVDTKPSTVNRYLDMIFASCIASKCMRYDVVGKKALKTLYKSYLSDLSIHTFYSGKKDKLDYGMLIENVVYNELVSRGYKVFVGKKGPYEIDFVVFNGLRKAYVQIAYSIADSNVREREEKPLLSMKDDYPKYIITMDPIAIEHDGLHFLNLLDDFLLGDKFII